MADNRIYIKCRVCGEELFLGKRYGENYFWENYWKETDKRHLEERLNQFYDKHTWCGYEDKVEDLFDKYEIVYENEPTWKIARKNGKSRTDIFNLMQRVEETDSKRTDTEGERDDTSK